MKILLYMYFRNLEPLGKTRSMYGLTKSWLAYIMTHIFYEFKARWHQSRRMLLLKEHCTQKKIWIHLMQNIFRNQTVKHLTILDNPFKRYDFSKFSLNSLKSLCRPHKLATVPCHGCTTPHWFCTQIIKNFQFSWIWVKLMIKLIPKSIQIHIYPKQTWLISRGNLLFTWELYF